MKVKLILKSIKESNKKRNDRVVLDNQTNITSHNLTINTPHSKSTRLVTGGPADLLLYDPAVDYLVEIYYREDDGMKKSSNSVILSKLIAGSKKNNISGAGNNNTNNNVNNSLNVSNREEENINNNVSTPTTTTSNNLNYSDKISDLKSIISAQTGIRIDSIELFKNLDLSSKISDNEEVSTYINTGTSPNNNNSNNANNQQSISTTSITHNIYAYPIIYFRKTEQPIRVVIEYFQNSIDKIIYELNFNCQVYMLKYLLNKRLNNTFPISEQNLTLVGLGVINNDPNCKNFGKLENSLDFGSYSPNEIKDEYTLDSVIYSMEITKDFLKHYPNSMKVVYMLLARKGERKCSIGIDFSFALLRNLKKLEFEEKAPSYREASDGLNIFCYCKNKNCGIFNQMFVKNIGVGTFDLIREIGLVQCVKCGENKTIEARNLGFVHCEWGYRGMLLNKNSSIVTGDGFTIDDKIYVMKETDLLSQIDRLEITVKSINTPVRKEFTHKNKENTENTLNSSFDDLDIQFSIKRKDLFGDGKGNSTGNDMDMDVNKSVNKSTNLSKINNLMDITSMSLVKSGNSNIKLIEGRNSKKSKLDDLNMSSNMDTHNGFINKKEDEMEIKLDNKRNATCCASFTENTKASCIIY